MFRAMGQHGTALPVSRGASALINRCLMRISSSSFNMRVEPLVYCDVFGQDSNIFKISKWQLMIQHLWLNWSQNSKLLPGDELPSTHMNFISICKRVHVRLVHWITWISCTDHRLIPCQVLWDKFLRANLKIRTNYKFLKRTGNYFFQFKIV